MKKYIFLIIAILLLCAILSSFTLKVHASMGLDIFNEDTLNQYIDDSEIDDRAVEPIINTVIWIIRAGGISISTIMLVIIGIKYILGSVEEKAEYKQTLWPYFVGSILTVAGTSIVSIIYNAFYSAG